MADDLPSWCRFYGDVPATLQYPPWPVHEAVRDTVRRYPDAIAWEFLGGRSSYRELGRAIDRAAAWLAALGLARGDRLMIVMPTSPQAVIGFYAAASIGAVAAMVHPLVTPVEIEGLARQSRARMALTLDALYARFATALDAGALETVVLARLADVLGPLRRFASWLSRGRRSHQVPADSRVRWWHELDRQRWPPAPAPALASDDPCAILFSGGTTGESKGILLSHRNLIAQGTQIARWVSLRRGDRVLAALPLFHGFGLSALVNAGLTSGCRVILVPEFSPQAVARLIRSSRPNFIAGVPSLYDTLSRSSALRGLDLSSLRVAFSGGDALKPAVKRRFDDLLAAGGSPARLLEGYGLTEAVSAVLATPLQLTRAGSIGVPFPDTLAVVCEPGTERELAVGEVGELCISSPAVMLGYLDDPATTAVALRPHADGRTWLHTGDLARRDADGFFYFAGRLKRLIKSSGFNVFPAQVERVLCEHPSVAEAYVAGVPDEGRGERVKAYVVAAKPGAATPQLAEELLAHCRGRLIKWSCPREIEFRQELPKNRVGKVDDHALMASAPPVADLAP